jgi:hypothetical protein
MADNSKTIKTLAFVAATVGVLSYIWHLQHTHWPPAEETNYYYIYVNDPNWI